MSQDPAAVLIDELATQLGPTWLITSGERDIDTITRPTVVIWTETIGYAKWDYPATVHLWVLTPERRTRPGQLFDALMTVLTALDTIDMVTTWATAERGVLGEKFIGYHLEIATTVTKGTP